MWSSRSQNTCARMRMRRSCATFVNVSRSHGAAHVDDTRLAHAACQNRARGQSVIQTDCPRCLTCVHACMNMYARTSQSRLLRPLEISTRSRAKTRTGLLNRRPVVFPMDIDRGYNRVCPYGPRSRPSKEHSVYRSWIPKTVDLRLGL